MTARALMQEALRMREESIENPEIVCVTPKAHGDRIIAYIKRQINAEMAQGKNTEKPEDFENTGEARDIEKARRYKRTIGLETAIRRFSPQEPPYVYELSECILNRQFNRALEILNRQEPTTRNRILISLISRISDKKTNTEKILARILDPHNFWAKTGHQRIF